VLGVGCLDAPAVWGWGAGAHCSRGGIEGIEAFLHMSHNSLVREFQGRQERRSDFGPELAGGGEHPMASISALPDGQGGVTGTHCAREGAVGRETRFLVGGMGNS